MTVTDSIKKWALRWLVDTLETILTDTLQQARLDTVRTLLQNKQWNMYAVLEAMHINKTKLFH